MLTAYREDGNDWRVEGAKLPDNIIWLDLLDPTPEEQQLVETRAKIRVPSKEALSEIEASSRLILQRGVLYLSTPMVARGELQTTENLTGRICADSKSSGDRQIQRFFIF